MTEHSLLSVLEMMKRSLKNGSYKQVDNLAVDWGDEFDYLTSEQWAQVYNKAKWLDRFPDSLSDFNTFVRSVINSGVSTQRDSRTYEQMVKDGTLTPEIDSMGHKLFKEVIYLAGVKDKWPKEKYEARYKKHLQRRREYDLYCQQICHEKGIKIDIGK